MRVFKILISYRTQKIAKILEKKRVARPILLAVSINSTGGFSQKYKKREIKFENFRMFSSGESNCSTFTKFRRHKKVDKKNVFLKNKKKRIPVYTFAEDCVFNSANAILMSGDKVFASINK